MNMRNIKKGDKFGNLLILEEVKSDARKKRYFKCQCKCGRILIRRTDTIKKDSLGCRYCAQEGNNIKHGMRNTPTYISWNCMKDRCYGNYPNSQNYKGKGITVCDEWKDDFIQFFNDMGERPKGKTLDRINNSKGYSPDNCRWATPKEQVNNRG